MLIKKKNKLIYNYKLIFLISALLFVFIKADSQIYPYEIDKYSFIEYDSNYLQFYGDSSNFEKLFYKFDTLFFHGKGQINIVQIGASHTQADIFSAQVRKRFQNFDYGYNAGRGYVFPYKMMKTNNPYDYKTSHTGNWNVCRNVENKNCELGLTGISATTSDSLATFSVYLKNNDLEIYHNFNRIRVFHSSDSLSFIPNLQIDTSLYQRVINFDKGYTEFLLNDFYTEISFCLEKYSDSQNYFSLYGIFIETDNPGIIYHPIGINGASTKSYQNLKYFAQQLEIINPDLIVIDLGTNDGYTNYFDSAEYHQNYKILLEQIFAVNQNLAVVTIVPNDCYLWKKKANKATPKQEEVLKNISKEYNVAVWDKYLIMGGLGSSLTWYKNNLMAYDKVHFTNSGYQLLGNLFFNAFLNSYDKHLEKIKIPIIEIE